MTNESMCTFSAETLRCSRCGYTAKSLPTFRVCKTVLEMAETLLEEKTTQRIKVPPVPLGGMVSTALAAVGVTKERVSKLIGQDCGCKARADALNYVGAGISKAVQNAANFALNLAIPSPYSQQEVADVANMIAASEWVNEGLRDAAMSSVSVPQNDSGSQG